VCILFIDEKSRGSSIFGEKGTDGRCIQYLSENVFRKLNYRFYSRGFYFLRAFIMFFFVEQFLGQKTYLKEFCMIKK